MKEFELQSKESFWKSWENEDIHDRSKNIFSFRKQISLDNLNLLADFRIDNLDSPVNERDK